jgi:transposase
MTDQQGCVESPVEVTGGVDTHKDVHVAAAKDGLGRVLGTRSFPATAAGFTALLGWLGGWGTVVAVGVEGTGSYGAGLAHYLTDRGVRVVEVNRPNRQKRRQQGKSDPLDAINAAAAVQSGDATVIPKAGTGPAAAVAALRTVRASAVKSRTVAVNQLDSLIVTAPVALRASLAGLTPTALVAHCARLRPTGELGDPTAASKTALRRLARRIQALTAEIRDADAELTPLLTTVLPRTMARMGVGPDTAGQLLTTIGDNPDRIATESRFAHGCGAAPIPASSGRTNKHRLNRGGDRHANAALYRIAIVRMRHCPRTRAYVHKRTAEGKTKREIIRCLKRYIAREIYHTLRADLANNA